MPEKFYISYANLSDESLDRVQRVLDLTGDSEKGFFGQIVRGYFKREHKYYVDALQLDAAARGIDQKQYAEIIIFQGEESLPAYVSDRPIFPSSPIAKIPDVDGTRKSLNYLLLNKRNTCLLRVARIVDGCAMTQLMSRLIEDHFRTHWAKTYQPQFKFEDTLMFD